MMSYEDGILMCGRFSVGWNLHHTRAIKTIALPLALTFAPRRVLITVGPFTFIWLL